MTSEFVPYLCGGIFFALLIESRNNTTTETEGTRKSKKPISQYIIMENLIRVINPEYCGYGDLNSFKKTVSDYRACRYHGGSIIPFEREYIKEGFEQSIRKQYGDVRKRMKRFINISFPECNDKFAMLLIKRTLTLICKDTKIEENDLFFINENGSPVSKKEILEKEKFDFFSFLVGIWHYIITKPTENKDGEKTYEILFPKNDGTERQLNTHWLKPYDHTIIITGLEISDESSSKEVYIDEYIAETAETDKNEKLAVEIYYKGSALNDEKEEKILSNSSEIINLNEYPDISLKDNPSSTIYKITEEFQFKTHFLSPKEESIRLYCSIGSLNISGTTSLKRWLSRSQFNEMRFHRKSLLTAWFQLNPQIENKYSVKYLLIGSITQ